MSLGAKTSCVKGERKKFFFYCAINRLNFWKNKKNTKNKKNADIFVVLYFHLAVTLSQLVTCLFYGQWLKYEGKLKMIYGAIMELKKALF